MSPQQPVGLGTRFDLGPVSLVDCSLDDAVALVTRAARAGASLPVHLCNAFTLSLAARDASYARALGGGSLNLVDGTPVTWYFRLRHGGAARGPVRGATLMRRVLDEPGIRHYLYGGTEEVLAHLRAAIGLQHPVAEVVGAESPPFRETSDEDVDHLVEALSRTGANVVWIGLGTPKQDILIDRLTRTHDCVALGVGAAFDFLSGQKREAPDFLHGTGLEWTHRLISEPGRLWRRYLWGNAGFLGLAARELWRADRRGSRD
jgi:N-acetylglucosaminyldiphosphoundecaprenol N-acetyl-beta-D-mannosaminyltransferase